MSGITHDYNTCYLGVTTRQDVERILLPLEVAPLTLGCANRDAHVFNTCSLGVTSRQGVSRALRRTTITGGRTSDPRMRDPRRSRLQLPTCPLREEDKCVCFLRDVPGRLVARMCVHRRHPLVSCRNVARPTNINQRTASRQVEAFGIPPGEYHRHRILSRWGLRDNNQQPLVHTARLPVHARSASTRSQRLVEVFLCRLTDRGRAEDIDLTSSYSPKGNPKAGFVRFVQDFN